MSTRCPDVPPEQPLLRRLARRQRQAQPQILQIREGSTHLRGSPKEEIPRTKKLPGLRTVSQICEAFAAANSNNTELRLAAQALGEKAGRIPIESLNSIVLTELMNQWKKDFATWTVYNKWQSLKRVIRALEEFGAPRRLDETLPRPQMPRPRETIATPEETARLLANATPCMKCVLLLLNDCGLRYSEVLRAAPEHYDRKTQTLTLKVKGGHLHTVPVSPELSKMLDLADSSDPRCFAAQLHRAAGMNFSTLRYHWHKLKKKSEVNPDLRMHDLRRTTAVALYESSKDLRAVQELLGHTNMRSTLHYLTHRDPTRLRSLMREIWTPRGKKP